MGDAARVAAEERFAARHAPQICSLLTTLETLAYCRQRFEQCLLAGEHDGAAIYRETFITTTLAMLDATAGLRPLIPCAECRGTGRRRPRSWEGAALLICGVCKGEGEFPVRSATELLGERPVSRG